MRWLTLGAALAVLGAGVGVGADARVDDGLEAVRSAPSLTAQAVDVSPEHPIELWTVTPPGGQPQTEFPTCQVQDADGETVPLEGEPHPVVEREGWTYRPFLLTPRWQVGADPAAEDLVLECTPSGSGLRLVEDQAGALVAAREIRSISAGVGGFGVVLAGLGGLAAWTRRRRDEEEVGPGDAAHEVLEVVRDRLDRTPQDDPPPRDGQPAPPPPQAQPRPRMRVDPDAWDPEPQRRPTSGYVFDHQDGPQERDDGR